MNPSPLPTGRGSAQLLMPALVGTAVRAGRSRVFRKMILPNRRIRANGRQLDLGTYFGSLARAEREGAFDSIPLQVADTHTKDPRYTEGTVRNLVHLPEGPDGDGLYADIEFADAKGASLIAKNPRVGVSVSMVENLEREEDGQTHRWPVALQHVLVTTDPHVRGMGAWHPIQLGRADVELTVDLSGATYDEITINEEEPVTAPTQTPPTEGTEAPDDGMVDLRVSAADRDLLTAFLADLRNAQDEDATGRGSGGSQGAPEGGASPDASPTGAPQNLDREGGEEDPIELMRAEIDAERQHRVDLQIELDRARAATEIEQLSNTGLAPAIINAARPLLEVARGTGTIELARGNGRTDRVDPTQIIRRVLHEVIELGRRGVGVIDLDTESGMHVGSESEQARRKAQLDVLDEMYPVD